MNKVRELASSLDASVHTVVGDDTPTALLDFAREMNATQLVIGTSRRSRWARIFNEGIGPAIVQQSGKIDVHMVTHEEAKRGFRLASLAPRERRVASWLAAVIIPSAICAVTVTVLDPYLDTGGESAIFFVGVLLVACLGGVAPAALSAVLSGLLLNYYLDRPAIQLHDRRTRQCHHRTGVAAHRRRGRRPGRRCHQTHPGSQARLPGGGVVDTVRRLGAARRGSRDAAGTCPRNLFAARGQHVAGAGRRQHGRESRGLRRQRSLL